MFIAALFQFGMTRVFICMIKFLHEGLGPAAFIYSDRNEASGAEAGSGGRGN